MKTYGECRYSSIIFYLSIRWRWVISFTPWPLYFLGKSPRYPLNKGLGGPQSWSGRCGVEKNFLILPTELSPALLLTVQICNFSKHWTDLCENFVYEFWIKMYWQIQLWPVTTNVWRRRSLVENVDMDPHLFIYLFVVYLRILPVDRIYSNWSSSNAPDLYSGGVRFESRPRHLLSWLRFIVVSPIIVHV
jgi:hypothetical protein